MCTTLLPTHKFKMVQGWAFLRWASNIVDQVELLIVATGHKSSSKADEDICKHPLPKKMYAIALVG